MRIRLFSAAMLIGVANQAHASCGSSFCTVNTRWDTQDMVNDKGLRIDLRYSYAKADTLRSGSNRVAAAIPDGTGQGEIENLRTVNQLLNLDLDYAINRNWNVAVDLPLVIRDHTHTFDAVGSFFPQQAKFTDLGDVRVSGKYKFATSADHTGSGIAFGVKLPTGVINKTMTPPDPANPTVPYLLERSSQPGTGSTDLLLGAHYYHAPAAAPWGWFVSGQYQAAVSTRNAYRPGNSLSLDVGVHYPFTPALTGLLQLNAQYKSRDTGVNANPASGGHSLNLSPGLSWGIAPRTSVYGFAQLPLVQYANPDPAIPGSGQLTARWSLALGISYNY
ncbi:MAG TPA: hypothetical protein VFK88_12090 [Gallionella sp.]|nr:hypothetical protein [Gallionella sp.]